MAYAPPIGEFYQELLALDVPVLLPLPRDITPSAYADNWGATTVHYLYVKFTGGTSAQSEFSFSESFALPIKVYDTLPLYRQFNEKVVESRLSADNQLVVQISLPVSAVGPQDPFMVQVDVSANPLHNKRRKNLLLKLVTLQMREIMECYDGGLPPKKENKFVSTTVDLDQMLTTEGISHRFEFEFPLENGSLEQYNSASTIGNQVVHSATALFNKNKNYTKLADGIPLTHVQGFTLLGKLYSLRYEVTVKVKINHGKDIDLTIPITVSPYDRHSSQYLLLWIRNECIEARDKFGKDTVLQVSRLHSHDEIQQILNHFCDGPRVYLNNREDWNCLGYDPQAYGKQGTGKPLVTFID